MFDGTLDAISEGRLLANDGFKDGSELEGTFVGVIVGDLVGN